MRRIAELVGQSLKWEQPSALKMNYELRTGDGELAALLHFRSSLGSFATAETAVMVAGHSSASDFFKPK